MIKFRGQFLPHSVSYLYVNFPVSPYFPRVLMCFEHFPSSPKCPVYMRQKQIYVYADTENVSYFEVRTKFGIASNSSFPPLNPTYSNEFLFLHKYMHSPRAPQSYHDLNSQDILGYLPEFADPKPSYGRTYAETVQSAPQRLYQRLFSSTRR
ncbi:hypothetical protein ALC60_06476 [Trachymyrmex zeteki]|uniref:Uncharacterized protein n=1 Tax=Mycetomoellerius zeteki TaxID=64791 RepID=A0A151X2Y8_9HYME|nr:hypothetical protein ALC60_06476 [Trachymyrmex zeteki]